MGGRRHRRVVRPSVVDDPAGGQDAPTEDASGAAPAASPPTRSVADDPVIPNRAAEDCDAVWGDSADSNDRRLREDVPPHW